ncbi:cobaltochelatase subunit CobN [Comamonas sp. Y6]|uniref:Cobaltochelatase subunit CobN n=1 Tax=Comamonas resistens TaxID=3046670 RepID=A0ABY8SNC4_9BURK|nr:cobaltochelatase subunit CobN [Comamonas resistens]MDL5038435.1 cobaltochelatase subunit CobN [Comamonas resistens]WHS64587.1 cobaltochelatase subunit CobN [Comamonas resistens]
MGWARGSIKTVWNWRSTLLAAVLFLVAAAALWMAWGAWLAPTRVALVHYPDFQAARMLKASPGAFTRAEVLPLARLNQARRYDLVLVFGRGLKLDDAQVQQLRAATQSGTPVYVDGATNPQHDMLTSLQGVDLDAVSAYLRGGGPVNYARLQTYTRRVLDGKRLFANQVEPPQPMPQDVFFHLSDEAVFADFASFEQYLQKQPGWKPGRPRLALLTSVPGPFNANRDHVDAAIRVFEARGFEVVPISAVRQRLAFLRQVDPAAVVYMPHGRLTVGQADEARQWLTEHNIPLFAPVSVFTEESEWLADQRSFDGSLLTMSVTLPEIDGATTPMAIAAQFRDRDGLRVFRALPQRLERFADLVQRTVALKAKANADKKLAIYYYKGPGQSALTAGDLEVTPSLYALLKRLRADGYRVDGLPATEADFARLLQRRGPNIGPYAKGDFAKFLGEADPAWVHATQLKDWCGQQIAQLLCDQVTRQFGPAPGVYLSEKASDKGRVAVARVPLGNVVLLPQPLSGVGDDTFKIVHGTQLAPPWPYVASYLWTREVFGADAVMHFGTHGSLEFTPSKQVALSDNDWPDALIGQVPHLYLYTMGNVGEAMIAKRRSYATIVSHLTPPLREGGAQSGYKQLADRLQTWGATGSPALKHQYAQDIQRLAVALGLHRDLSFAAEQPWSDAQLEQLADHMETVEDARITAGLYTLGTPYAPPALDATARLMGLDAVVQALAELDVVRGTVRREQLDHSAWLARTYRPHAETLIARAERGEAATPLLAQVVQPGELQRALNWEKAQRRPGDDDLVRGLIAMGDSRARRAPASDTVADDGALRQHLARALANPKKREFLEGLRSDQKLKQALRSLDPESLQSARTVAKAIPAMAQALEIAADSDVKPLLSAMQSEPMRRKILGWLADPELRARTEAEAGRAKEALQAQAREHQGALETAEATPDAQAAQQRIQGLDAPAQARLLAALHFWQQAPALQDSWQARRQDAAAGIAHLTQALERSATRRAEDERRFAQAVLTLRERLQAIPHYRGQLAESPARELTALTNALAGGFTPPSSGGDPLVNPAALPTGRNLFAIDAEKTPSEQAWTVGRQLADQMLAQHRAAHEGQWPSKVAFTLWAGDFIHTEGTSVAQILYLLGVAPVRDPFGRVSGLRLIPREELGRPRIDVVVQTSGQLRDLAASRLYLINKAVTMAAQAREQDNAVAQGVQAVERALKERGASPADARRFAAVRVFGGVNGNYGSGIMGMVEAGDRWRDRSEVAHTYLANMGAAFGEGDLWGAFQSGAFEAALAGTQVVVQPLESNTWGPISLDHVYEFMGGLNLAVREVTGQEPAAYFSDYRNPSRPTVREAKTAIAVEARATVLNPAYIEAMAQGGASSAEVFAETFRNLYGWNVMKPDAIPTEMWDALHDTYVRDAHGLGTRQFFERANPYALQEMTAVMLETARKGYWQPGDARLREVADLHADLVARFGASGTGFVNDNRALHGFIAEQVAPDARQAYDDALQNANEGAAIATDKATVLRKADDRPAAQHAGDQAAEQGRAPGEATPEQSMALRPGAAAIAVLAGALLVLGALVWRLRRRHPGARA